MAALDRKARYHYEPAKKTTEGHQKWFCGRVAHASRSAARRSVKRLSGSGRKLRDGYLHEYWCDTCSAWHIGFTTDTRRMP